MQKTTRSRKKQEEGLDGLIYTVKNIKTGGKAVGKELEKQNGMLGLRFD